MHETCYIWVNPVAAQLHPPEELERLLERHHCIPVSCREDWGSIVREQYRALAAREGRVIADARCPMAANLVRSMSDHREEQRLAVAEIEPILIHAARELAARIDLQDRPKLITTPCRALADLGSGLDLPDTHFIPWNQLLAQWGETPPVRSLEASPIPPGFFDGCGMSVGKYTGIEAITACVTSGQYGDARLLELLYCPGGCHTGDGVPHGT